jgi:hypothetical protein
MSDYTYILEPYKGMNTRYHCPYCNCKVKKFTRYINSETGEHLADHVGKCERIDSCGIHYKPKQYLQDNGIAFEKIKFPDKQKKTNLAQKPASFISFELFTASLKNYESNHFVSFLKTNFGNEITSQLISKYFIGSSKHWQGATLFWQIDTTGKIRTGKIMLYDPEIGKRIKEPFNHITWVHKIIKQDEFELGQCLFGSHLLKDISKPVAIVESEKTAIMASVYLPQFIWLASGSLNNLNDEKCAILKGRTVILFPDLNGFDTWNDKAKELSHLANFSVSDLLERKASESEKKQGFDLADYLIKFDHKEFISKPEIKQELLLTSLETADEVLLAENFKPFRKEPETWNQEIANLEYFFNNVTLPTYLLKLKHCGTITNVALFIESHLATLKANNGNKTFLPHLDRLFELKLLLR